MTTEALHYGPQIFCTSLEVHSARIPLPLVLQVLGDFLVNLLDQLWDVRVSGVAGLEVVLLLSKNCHFSWEEWPDLADAAGWNGSGGGLLQYFLGIGAHQHRCRSVWVLCQRLPRSGL